VIPNYKKEVEDAKARYADAWSHAHVAGDPRRWDWIKLFAADLHAKDPRVGLNGKRGNSNDLSMDAINFLCDASDSAGRTPEGLPCAVVDCIASAGIPSQSPAWTPFTTLVEGSGAWVKPGTVTPPQPQPEPQPPSFPYPDENTAGKAFQVRVKQAYTDANRPFPDPNDQDAFRHFMRYGYSARAMPEPEAADKHIAELRAQLGV
jgi:hypothetical protein